MPPVNNKREERRRNENKARGEKRGEKQTKEKISISPEHYCLSPDREMKNKEE